MDKIREYPIKYLWYTRYKGLTIEELIDKHPDFFCWMVKTFQNITPLQAQYFKERWSKEIKQEYIRDVEPYEYVKGDPEEMYIDLCKTQDLKKTLIKWRTIQDSLF